MYQPNLSTKLSAIILALLVLFSSCASTTLIQSTPSGAKVYLNGEHVGTTPYTHSDTRIVGSTNAVKLEKDGYEPLMASFSRDEEVDVGAVIGGLFIVLPFLWVMKYKPVHAYNLKPNAVQPQPISQPVLQKTKAERLRELKQLVDDKIITQDEFEKEKKKILDEPGQ